MVSLPAILQPLFRDFAATFTVPTFQRFLSLLWAAILTTGRRTISNLLRLAAFEGNSSTYRKVLSQRRWSLWQLADALAGFILAVLTPQGPVHLVVDDTVTEHRGRRVFGKGRHRDAVRSSHNYATFLWGHRWVVLAVLVRVPLVRRPWALPLLVALYRTPKDDTARGHVHRTPPQLAALLVRWMLRRFPGRCFRVSGDGEYSTHALAALAAAHPGRLIWVGKLPAQANFYAPAPSVTGRRKPGRPAKKGAKQPSPAQVVARKSARKRRLRVDWYGGQPRKVEIVTGLGYWYQAGHALLALKWVYVHDLQGTHRDEYFFSTDVRLSAAQIIAEYTGRWSIEVTFQELKTYLGLGSTRGRKEKTIKRAEPCLFGLYSLVVLLDIHLPLPARSGEVAWEGKCERTFSDALTSVRRWLWPQWGFGTPFHAKAFAKLPTKLQSLLLYALAPAA